MAIIQSIQQGSQTLDTDGTSTDITISAVTLSRAWVIVSVRSGSPQHQNYLLQSRLTSTTNLNIDRYKKTVGGVVVEWVVVEFTSDSGIAVQTGSWTTETSVTISAVTVAESHAETTFYYIDGSLSADETVRVKITGTTTLSLFDLQSNTKYYQVVDWNGYADVQTIDISVLVTDTTTKNNTLSSLTDYTKTVTIGSSSFASGAWHAEDICILYCDSNTNLVSERDTGTQTHTITAQVIEFVSSAIEVQQFETSMAVATASTTETLTTVDTDKTAIIPGSGYLHFSTSNAADDDCGDFGVIYDLTSSVLATLTRSESDNTCKSAFSVVEFDTGVTAHPWFYYNRRLRR